MKKILFIITILLILSSCKNRPSNPIVIAHRGASGYLPEHTLEAKAMAFSMNPDFIEQDVALTKDNIPIVIHDHYLDTVTNVLKIFPNKKRKDGRYYAIDFTLKEIKKLTVHERIDLEKKTPSFPERFPLSNSIDFKIPTLEEEILLIQGLNKSMKRNIGIYTELKAPWFHKQEGKDIAKIVLKIFRKYNYTDKNSNCFIQSFDPECLKYIKNKLKVKIKLVQLIADNSWDETPGVDYNKMQTEQGLSEIAKYAEGIGPWIDQIVLSADKYTDLVKFAHKYGLLVHPYTFRKDDLPEYVTKLDDLFKILIDKVGVDGVFTDFPDMGVKFIKNR